MQPFHAPRPRAVSTHVGARIHNDTKYKELKKQLMLHFLEFRINNGIRDALSGPVRYRAVAIYARIKEEWFRYKKTGVWKYGADRIPLTKKPDVDNALKPHLDAATEAALLVEDAKVFSADFHQMIQNVYEPTGIHFHFTEYRLG